ncbi:hypothetical protein O181_111483 [Austropuccinia psidii MF-1]|uniref:Uncharacterized protein n=1 Tax=Austropuccinia psidii MF-1 TaxID=1389203 RepID=A0A9Q3JZL2_9BASI|nr:hypothetical protein [Austropuccinia psidii MF-1]
MFWFTKQKEILTCLHPDMSGKMVHKKILRKCCGDLENPIRSSCIKPCSTEDYIKAMGDITTSMKIGRNWYKPQIDNKTSRKPISKKIKPQDRDPLKCYKFGSTSHLANTCPKKTRINEIEIKKSEDKKGTNDLSLHESYSEICEEEELPDKLSIENINLYFEVTEVHTHLLQYSDEFIDLKNLKYS